MAVHVSYPPAEASKYIDGKVQALTGRSRQVSNNLVGEEALDAHDPLPSEIEWPLEPSGCSGPLAVSVPRKLARVQAFIANLLCGQMREGTVQHAVEIPRRAIPRRLSSLSCRLICCSIKSQGHLTRPGSAQSWIRHIKVGRIVALGGGPPCETLSVARWRERGPPLRSWQAPWGITGLRTAHRLQASVAKDLFQAHVEILCAMDVAQG
eukprot:7763913-Pyramimonas_sp.AAC.1